MELEKEIKQKQFASEFQKSILNVIFTNSWLHSKYTSLFKPLGLSQQQYNILRILRGQYPKPASVSLLMDRMLDKNSNSSRLVEKLRKKGLVDRQECEWDRRQVDVIITQAGLDLLEEIDHKMLEFEGGIRHISEEEARDLNRILDKFRG